MFVFRLIYLVFKITIIKKILKEFLRSKCLFISLEKKIKKFMTSDLSNLKCNLEKMNSNNHE